jgi:hypothetical protein
MKVLQNFLSSLHNECLVTNHSLLVEVTWLPASPYIFLKLRVENFTYMFVALGNHLMVSSHNFRVQTINSVTWTHTTFMSSQGGVWFPASAPAWLTGCNLPLIGCLHFAQRLVHLMQRTPLRLWRNVEVHF